MQKSSLRPLFIYYTDLLKIYPNIKSVSGAHVKYKTIKKRLGKEDHQLIPVREFARWIGVDEDELIMVLFG